MSPLRISNNVDELDLDLIHRFLGRESTWAKGIPLETVRRSIANSLNFGGFVGTEQVCYARVVSDYATFAYLGDVFVLAQHRGRGHATALMRAVLSHPQLQGLRRFLLVTSSAHDLYTRFGFTAPAKPESLMERFVPDPYEKPPPGAR